MQQPVQSIESGMTSNDFAASETTAGSGGWLNRGELRFDALVKQPQTGSRSDPHVALFVSVDDEWDLTG